MRTILLLDKHEETALKHGEHIPLHIAGEVVMLGLASVPPKKEKFICDLCDRKPFKTKMGLAVHRARHNKSNGK